MAGRRTADVTVQLYWDEAHKRWTGTVTGKFHSQFKRIETTSPVGQAESWLLLDAVAREMESWLPLEQG